MSPIGQVLLEINRQNHHNLTQANDICILFFCFRIFSSNLKERMAQRFYNLVLLPRVRDDIAEYKRLNFHLYSALKKALFKPGAWFKGETEKGYLASPRVR